MAERILPERDLSFALHPAIVAISRNPGRVSATEHAEFVDTLKRLPRAADTQGVTHRL